MKRKNHGRNFPLWMMLAMATVLAMACSKDEINNVSPESDDVIDSIIIDDGDYDRIVQVVFSTSGDATVTGTGDSVSATVSGNDVTVTNISGKKVMLMTSVAVMMLFTNSRDESMAAFHRLMPASILSR